jgi:hypothetical protein
MGFLDTYPRGAVVVVLDGFRPTGAVVVVDFDVVLPLAFAVSCFASFAVVPAGAALDSSAALEAVEAATGTP